jgi:hypothetical protein
MPPLLGNLLPQSGKKFELHVIVEGTELKGPMAKS